MRALHALFLLLLLSLAPAAQDGGPKAGPIPGKTWEVVPDPEAFGFSKAKLEEAKKFWESIPDAAFMAILDGRLIVSWGMTDRVMHVASVRKSFLSALYGIHVAEGRINLDKTMADLGIDDCEPKLSDTEKKATVRMLLQARSGIYHPAHAETESMKRAKPARHSHEPGSFWYYNNWDFNALGTIFMQETEKDLFDELRTRIAEPLGFEDYDPKRNVYRPTKESPISIHAAYPMVLSCRDMARFGLLYLRKGRWGDKQIVPESWVDETFKPHSPRYGYMWWISQNGRPFPNLKVDGAAYSANGNKGHYILIVPSIRMVFVGRPDLPKERSGADFGKLVQMVLDARTN